MRLALTTAAIAVGACGTEPGGDEPPATEVEVDRATMPRFVPMQAIVKLKARPGGSGPVALQAPSTEAQLVQLPDDAGAKADPIAATWAKIDELRARDDVEYAHPNWLFDLSRVPNDPQYGNQWHYPLAQLPAAWDVTTGSRDIRIAILDSGRTAHPDLAGEWTPGLDYDAAAQDGVAAADPATTWHHGVHVAGIAGGGSNNGVGTSGVCWGCQIVNVKVVQNDGSPDMDAAGRGIRWAVDQGIQVINMSFEANGLPCSHPNWSAMREAVAYATSRNVTVVAAAGNQGLDAANTVPASCPGVIAVAATDRTNTLAQYSNRGAVTLAAPGGGATLVAGAIGPDARGQGIGCPADPSSSFGTSTEGAFAAWTTSNLGHCARYLSGTSMAAPHVAGIVGLMLSRDPSLTPARVRQILVSTAQPLPGCGGACGAGLVNALGAVLQVAPLPAGDPPPTASFTVSCAGLECTFDGRSSTDNAAIVAYQWAFPGQQLRTGAVASSFMPGYANHTVRLRVTDSTGQSAETTRVVTPSAPFVAPLFGQYYNPQRSGNGLDFFENGAGDWTASWYTYDTTGAPVWYITGTGPRNGARWSQPLYRATWNGSAASVAQVGTIGLDFSSSTTAWLSWVLNGVPGGERYTYIGGGGGRSGNWYTPSESGWGIQVQETAANLIATVAFYDNGQPRWMTGATTPGANVTVPLSYYLGAGLCPSCGGSTAPRVDTGWAASTMNLQIADGSSTTGFASTNIVIQFSFPRWQRPLRPIALLTKP